MSGCPELLPPDDAQIVVDGQVVTVVRATASDSGADVFITRADGRPAMVSLTCEELASAAVPERDGGGNGARALACLWASWMRHAVPRIRSAVLATRPLEPFAHQDEAVFRYMLRQPRLRFLLADEPGTGKTIMTGMYLAEATRRGLLPGSTVIAVQSLTQTLRAYRPDPVAPVDPPEGHDDDDKGTGDHGTGSGDDGRRKSGGTAVVTPDPVKPTATEDAKYRRYTVRLENRSLTAPGAREDVWKLLRELGKILDPSSRGDHQLLDLTVTLNTREGDQGQIEQRATDAGGTTLSEADDF